MTSTRHDDLALPGRVRATILVRGADTGDTLTLMRDTAPPGWQLPPHSHTRESETIHVTAGRLWMELGGVRRVVGPGETVHVPAGVRHLGGTEGGEPVQRLVAFTPGGMDRLFAELARAAPEDGGLALALAYGWRFG